MGYTHYWRTPKTLNKKKWSQFTADVNKIFAFAEKELDIKLADGVANAGSRPEANDKRICFNGSDEQPAGKWTTTEDIVIPWPSATASITEPSEMPFEKTEGNWFAGHVVSQRVAPIREGEFGSGSYETVMIDRIQGKDYEPDEYGLYFNCCKTAYRPYDLVVTAVLIALKHYYPECRISSDGEEKDWLDGRLLCLQLFGYGMKEEIKVFVPKKTEGAE